MTPQRLALIVACWVASMALCAAGAGWWAYGAGRNAEVATRSREDQAAARAADAAASAAAAAIARIEVKHITVRQQLEQEVRTREVYRDCRTGPDAVRLFNSTLPGAAASTPGDGSLPAADPDR